MLGEWESLLVTSMMRGCSGDIPEMQREEGHRMLVS